MTIIEMQRGLRGLQRTLPQPSSSCFKALNRGAQAHMLGFIGGEPGYFRVVSNTAGDTLTINTVLPYMLSEKRLGIVLA
jgi:hypothetical protein